MENRLFERGFKKSTQKYDHDDYLLPIIKTISVIATAVMFIIFLWDHSAELNLFFCLFSDLLFNWHV